MHGRAGGDQFRFQSAIFGKLALSMIEQGAPKKSRRRRSAMLLACAGLFLIAEIPGAVAARAGELTPGDLVLLDRLTWGITSSSAAHLQAVGSERWLQEQLHPAAVTALPDAARTQIEVSERQARVLRSIIPGL